MLTSTIKCAGSYDVYKNDELVAESKNILTNGFFDRISSRSSNVHYAWLMCGDGTTDPTIADIGLESPLAGAVSPRVDIDDTSNYIDANGPTIFSTYKYTFPAGTFTGTVSEVGCRFHSSTSGITENSAVDSRTLLKDEFGTPTPVVVGPTDVITIVFKYFTVWPVQATGSINIMGTIHTVTWELLDYSYWGTLVQFGDNYNGFGQWGEFSNARGSSTQELINNVSWNSTISGSTVIGFVNSAYNSSHSITDVLRFDIPEALLATGVKYIHGRMDYYNRTRYGLHFDPPLTNPDSVITYVSVKFSYQNL